eukprot:7389770-Prymnesium_polylepis.1
MAKHALAEAGDARVLREKLLTSIPALDDRQLAIHVSDRRDLKCATLRCTACSLIDRHAPNEEAQLALTAPRRLQNFNGKGTKGHVLAPALDVLAAVRVRVLAGKSLVGQRVQLQTVLLCEREHLVISHPQQH